jgi:hypothetical protein
MCLTFRLHRLKFDSYGNRIAGWKRLLQRLIEQLI